jgi:hypothetical protein
MKAVINLTIVGLLFNFLHFTNQKPLLNTDCLNYVQKLSNQDKCLASRVDLKLSTARKVQNTNQFYSSIKNNPSKCNGTAYSCGNTMSWVSEAFLGLTAQYDEYKNGFQGPNAGYKNLIGDDLKSLFTNNRYNPGHIIYQVRHNGTEDHVNILLFHKFLFFNKQLLINKGLGY